MEPFSSFSSVVAVGATIATCSLACFTNPERMAAHLLVGGAAGITADAMVEFGFVVAVIAANVTAFAVTPAGVTVTEGVVL